MLKGKQELTSGPVCMRIGWAAAENIWYLQDMNNVLAKELFPQLTERFDDWLAHPGPGRVADEVAEFYFLHRSADLDFAPLKPGKANRYLCRFKCVTSVFAHYPGKMQGGWQSFTGSIRCPSGSS